MARDGLDRKSDYLRLHSDLCFGAFLRPMAGKAPLSIPVRAALFVRGQLSDIFEGFACLARTCASRGMALAPQISPQTGPRGFVRRRVDSSCCGISFLQC